MVPTYPHYHLSPNASDLRQKKSMVGLEDRARPLLDRVIVVAEDDEGIRGLLVEALADEGYRVLGAVDGAAALTLIERAQPDLLPTDNMMPRLTGQALIAHLRDGGTPLPVILTSAAPPGEVAPPTIFVRKPFDLDTLIVTVKSLLPLESLLFVIPTRILTIYIIIRAIILSGGTPSCPIIALPS